MPSPESLELIHKIIDILKDRRMESESTLDDSRTKHLSLRQLSAVSGLEIGALSRAEEKERIPSFAFFVDWASALNTSIEDVVSDARKRLDDPETPR